MNINDKIQSKLCSIFPDAVLRSRATQLLADCTKENCMFSDRVQLAILNLFLTILAYAS